MRVIHTATGQLGDIPDNKFDPSIFQQADQNGKPIQSQQGQLSIEGPSTIEDLTKNNTDNGLLNFLVPAAGGVLGGIGGEALAGPVGAVGGAGAGQAAGQFLLDLLTGKKPGGDVVGQGVGGLIGGGVGVVGSKVLGSLLGNVGEDLATGGLNLTKGQLAKFAAAHGEDLSSVLKRNNLAGANLDSLQGGIDNLQEVYNGIAKDATTPIDPKVLYGNIENVVTKLRNSPVESDKQLADTVEKNFQNVLGNLGENPTLADINAAKQSFDKATSDSQFGSSQWGGNRFVGDTLRKTLNDSADAAGLTASDGRPLSQVGTDLMKLRNVAETAGNRQGVGGALNPFSISNLVLGGEGGMLAGAVGANPIVGMVAAPAVRLGVSAARNNPVIAKILSTAATSAGKGITTAAPILGVGGAIAGGAIGGNSSLVGPNESANTNNNQKQNQSSQSGAIVQQSSDNVKDENGNYQLPSLDQAKAVPQIYPIQNYLSDLQKAGNNPVAMERINAAYKASQEQAQQYISQHQLEPQERAFMQTAAQTNEMMNTLRGLLKEKGNSNIFQAVLSDNPVTQYLKAQTDPKYAQMLSIMSSLKGAAVRAVEGGRPSNFDIKVFNNAPAAGDTSETALAKLDQTQKFLVDQYKRQLPAYSATLMGDQMQGGGSVSQDTTQAPNSNVQLLQQLGLLK